MAVTPLATTSDIKISSSTAVGDFTHTVDSGTELLFLAVVVEGWEVLNETPIWDEAGVNETFTLINDSGLQDGSDVRVYTYGLKNPTAKTATIKVRLQTSGNPWWNAARNYSNVLAGTVADCTNHLSDDVNLLGTSAQAVHASAGTAGNALILVGAAQGNDMTPATQSAGNTFTEVFDTNTGPDAVPDFSVYYAELLDNAPSAITVDWNTTDQNTTSFIEILAAAEAPSQKIVTSVEYLTVDWDGTSEPVTVNLTKGQDETQCVPFFTKQLVSGSVVDDFRERTMKVEIINNAGTAAVRVNAPGKADTDDHRIKVFVVEFEPEITVQQVDADLPTAVLSTNISITDISDQSTAFMLYSYSYNHTSAQDIAAHCCIRPIWNGAATDSVTLERYSPTGTIDGVLYVVSCAAGEFTVDHRDITMAITDELTNDTITAVVPARTFLISHFRVNETQDDPLDWSIVADLSSATNVRLRRSISGASNAEAKVAVQVVEGQGSRWTVERGDHVTTSTNPETTVISAIDTNRAIVKTGTHAAGVNAFGTSDLTNGNTVDELGPAVHFSATNSLSWSRDSTAETGNIIPWEVVEFTAGVGHVIIIGTGPLR